MTGAERIEAIVLAAGQSTRMGAMNKLLLDVDGAPMVRKVVEAVRGGGVDGVTVVTGFERECVETALAGLDARFVFNENYSEGMGSSLAAGALSIDGRDVLGVLICLADLPRLNAKVIDQVVARFRDLDGQRIVAPAFEGRMGHPVVFPVRYLSFLASISGDRGAKQLMEDGDMLGVEVNDDSVIRDIDSPSDL